MADDTLYQFHLSGFGHSGRGVRVRQLQPDVVHQCEAEAAATVGKTGTALAYRQATLDEGVSRMVAEVTDPVGGTRPTEDGKAVPRTILDTDVTWRPVTLQEMKHRLSDLFTAKDVALLEGVYGRLHEVSQGAVEEIMGKALPVTT